MKIHLMFPELPCQTITNSPRPKKRPKGMQAPVWPYKGKILRYMVIANKNNFSRLYLMSDLTEAHVRFVLLCLH